MCSLPCRKHVYQEYLVLQPMGSSTQSTGLARAFQWKKDGKEQGNGTHTMLLCAQAGLFCSTRALVSSVLPSLNYTISLIKGEGVGPRTRTLHSKLYPQNSCEVTNLPAIIWSASPDWHIPGHCLGVPNGDQQASPMEPLPTPLGIKPVPPGNACSFSLG